LVKEDTKCRDLAQVVASEKEAHLIKVKGSKQAKRQGQKFGDPVNLGSPVGK
jgi:hypothetical protein